VVAMIYPFADELESAQYNGLPRGKVKGDGA
jgi:hypothetical protein